MCRVVGQLHPTPSSLQMRYTKKMSVWPVGICGGLRWEGPVCENGAVKRWHTAWAKERPFPIDFAGTAR